jgi:hypothetical protein
MDLSNALKILLPTVGVVGGAVVAAVKWAGDRWTKAHDTLVETLRTGTAQSVEREKALTEALTRNTIALDAIRSHLDTCDVEESRPRRASRIPTGEHPAGRS